MIKKFTPDILNKLYKPDVNSQGEDNGQITIIGGSSLFHGAPIMALKSASRVVDMVFFSSPEKTMEEIASYVKASVASFIWVPFLEIEKYIEKSDACLIGPGMMRFSSEEDDDSKRKIECDEACQLTKSVSKKLLTKYKNKKWVIDAGALQTIDKEIIPPNAIITPNRREFELLFNIKTENPEIVEQTAKKYKCTILFKGPTGIVSDGETTYLVEGGNGGLTKGGVGDVLAGLTTGLYAKNDGLLSATCASYLIKKQAEKFSEDLGLYFNAEDLSQFPL